MIYYQIKAVKFCCVIRAELLESDTILALGIHVIRRTESPTGCRCPSRRRRENDMEMGDLISRKALIERYGEPSPSFLDVIETMPAIDAEPVRHGRWIQVKTAPSYHYCSYCKSTHKMTMSCNKYVLLKYCPHCGAKMN